MAARNSLTAQRLRELLRYDPESGIFYWIAHRRGLQIGDIAGREASRGEWRITVDYVEYVAARLAWLYMTGEWPSHEIDHRDQQKLNNKWDNLRPATRPQNASNRSGFRTNRHKYKGVSFLTRLK